MPVTILWGICLFLCIDSKKYRKKTSINFYKIFTFKCYELKQRSSLENKSTLNILFMFFVKYITNIQVKVPLT